MNAYNPKLNKRKTCSVLNLTYRIDKKIGSPPRISDVFTSSPIKSPNPMIINIREPNKTSRDTADRGKSINT